MTIEVPVKFENEEECPGIKKGGILNIVRYNIEVSCPASNIPELFIIDLTGLELGDSIRFSDIKIFLMELLQLLQTEISSLQAL